MQENHTVAFLRKRKFMLILPLLVLPFLTLGFWSLGGGKIEGDDETTNREGLNLELPNAFLKEDKDLTKLSFYEQAARDSAKRTQFDQSTYGSNAMETYLNNGEPGSSLSYDPTPYNLHGQRDPNEEKVYRKLQQLNSQLSNPSSSGKNSLSSNTGKQESTYSVDNNIAELERMLGTTKNRSVEDPELKQLNGMMDKILDIQHPERIREKLKNTSEKNKEHVFVAHAKTGMAETYFGSPDETNNEGLKQKPGYGFFTTDSQERNDPAHQNAIEATVHESIAVVNGSSVKMRLLNDVYINGVLVPKNTFIYGTASIAEERLRIEIKSIRSNTSIFPVLLTAYDLDGIEGIYVPGTADAAQAAVRSKENMMQKVDLGSIDPSLKGRAAGAAIETAKSLITKRTKQTPVTIKSGYLVLLKNKNENL